MDQQTKVLTLNLSLGINRPVSLSICLSGPTGWVSLSIFLCGSAYQFLSQSVSVDLQPSFTLNLSLWPNKPKLSLPICLCGTTNQSYHSQSVSVDQQTKVLTLNLSLGINRPVATLNLSQLTNRSGLTLNLSLWISIPVSLSICLCVSTAQFFSHSVSVVQKISC